MVIKISRVYRSYPYFSLKLGLRAKHVPSTRKRSKTLLDETTQRRLLLKEKVKSFPPIEKPKKITYNEKHSQSQHFQLVNPLLLSHQQNEKRRKNAKCNIGFFQRTSGHGETSVSVLFSYFTSGKAVKKFRVR